MRSLSSRLVLLERRSGPAGRIGPYGPGTKPPFDHAGFVIVFREQWEARRAALGRNHRPGTCPAEMDSEGDD
jgi:hypothetical protein